MNEAIKKNKATIVAAIIIAVAVVALFVVMRPQAGDSEGYRALVHDSDGQVHELPLAKDAQITVTTELGSNTVTVKDGAVSVTDADCENHDCMRQGSLDAPGRQLICLPHKLWIEVVAADGASGEMNVEAVASADGEQFDTVAR